MTFKIAELKDKHKGEIAYIVGKGPSLEHLTSDMLGPGPVIALSQSIIKINRIQPNNKVYFLQKDGLKAIPPEHHNLLESAAREIKDVVILIHKHESNDYLPEFGNRYVFDNFVDFNLEPNTISAITAVKIAHLMGCEKVVLISHDAAEKIDIRSWNPNGPPLYYGPSSYIRNGFMLRKYLEKNKIKHEWLTPAGEIADTFSPKLLIATPFYEVKAFSPYIKPLLGIVQLSIMSGFLFEYLPLNGDSYVDRAKNTIIANFMESDATDLLMIDSDLEWGFTDEQAVMNIICSPHEIIAGAFPLKNKGGEFGVSYDTNPDGIRYGDAQNGLLCVSRVPGGFLKIKRTAIEKLYAAYKGDFYFDNSSGKEFACCALFKTVIKDNLFYGEDIVFCDKWRAIGGQIYLEPRITFRHHGVTYWEGNLHETLLKQKESSIDNA